MTMCVCTSDELKSVTRLYGSPARRVSRGISIGDLLSYGHLIGLFGLGSLPLLAGALPFLGLHSGPRVLFTEAAVLMPIPPIESIGRNRIHEFHREVRLRQRIRHERHARCAIEAG